MTGLPVDSPSVDQPAPDQSPESGGTQPAVPAAAPTPPPAGTGLVLKGLSRLARWETLLFVLLIGVIVYNSHLSPYFWDANNLFDDTSNFASIGIEALPMTLIIICGQIDLSVGSNAFLCSTIFATIWMHGWNVWLACVIALVVGTVAGMANGVVVTRFRLPSLVVTLGTYALYRGIGTGILGTSSGITGFPADFVGIDVRYLPGTHIPAPLVIFAVLALLMALLLGSTTTGRYIFAVGHNQLASRFSGIAVDRLLVMLFGLSGLFAALAGLIETSRLSSSTPTIGTSFELDAITAAVLGGANIFGGEGSIFGTVIAIFIIGLLQIGFDLANLSADISQIAIGALLILSILVRTSWSRLRLGLGQRGGGDATATLTS